jgi:adenosylhomocysteine nucleosidase
MTTGIIGAMEPEVKDLASKLKSHTVKNIGGYDFHFGKLQDRDTVVVQCGIGKVAAGAVTALLVCAAGATRVINTGCAGAISTGLRIGDTVFSSKAAYHDANLTPFGYPMGQMAGQERFFNADPELMAKAEIAAGNLPEFKDHVRQGLVVSGDQFINTEEKRAAIRAIYPDAMVAEMEGAAIAQVCTSLHVPFLIIRAVSDEASEGNTVNYDEFMPKAAALSEKLVTALVALL